MWRRRCRCEFREGPWGGTDYRTGRFCPSSFCLLPFAFCLRPFALHCLTKLITILFTQFVALCDIGPKCVLTDCAFLLHFLLMSLKRKKRVLAIDDEPSMTEWLKILLEHEG